MLYAQASFARSGQIHKLYMMHISQRDWYDILSLEAIEADIGFYYWDLGTLEGNGMISCTTRSSTNCPAQDHDVVA
jgi:hypothetical protein